MSRSRWGAPPRGAPHRRFALAVASAALLPYASTLSAGFVAGDLQFIVQNDAIKHASVLWTAFTKGYWWVGGDSSAGTYYRPLTVLLDALDQAVWRGRPAGFHLTNLLLHLAASLLVLSLARAFTRSHFTALAAALVFAVHPIHAGATSYVSARSTLLATAFAAASVLACLRWRRAVATGPPPPSRTTAPGSGRTRHLLVALACYAGALLSAEAAITLPILLAGAALPARSGDRRAWRAELLPFGCAVLLLTAGYFAVRHAVLGGALSGKEAMWQHLGAAPAVLTMAKTYGFYLVKLVAPTDLSYLPPFLPVLHTEDATGILSLALLLALAGFAALGPRRWIRERAALGWILVTLAPVSGVVPLDHFVKAHYAYLPSVGAAILAASLARRALRAASRALPRRTALLAVGGALGVALFAGAVQTALDNLSWRSQEALHAHVLELEPEIPDDLFPHPVMTPTANRFAAVHLDIAAALFEERRCDQVLAHAARARRLTRQRSVDRDARRLAAHCLLALGDREGALALYLGLVDDAPGDPMPPARVAKEYLRRGETDAALPYLRRACERGAAPACEEEARLRQAAEAGRR